MAHNLSLMTELDTEYKDSFEYRFPKFDCGAGEKHESYDARTTTNSEDTTTFSAKSSGEVKRCLENMSRNIYKNEISAEKLLGAEVDGYCFLQLSEEDFEYLGYSKGEIEVLVALRNRLKGSTSDRDAHRADVGTYRSKRQQGGGCVGGGGGTAAARLHKGLSSPIQYQSPDVNEELLYGELIVVGYSDYRLSSHDEYVPVGAANERFQLKRRASSNGKKIARVDSNCFADQKCEEKEDSRGDLTTRAADENKQTNNIFLGNSMKVSLVDDPSVDCFQLGRDLYNDFSVPGPRHISDGQKIAGPVPRQACRVICERSFPYRCYIYAGGFDENGSMQVPQERVIIKSKPLDGVSRYGLYMWSPARKDWAEISVLGNSYPSRTFKPCRKHPDIDSAEISRTSIGSLAGRPMNQLIDGSLLDIGGVVLLFRNRRILFDNDMENPLTVVAEFNAMNPQCPVMMHTLYFCHLSLLERKIRSEQRLRETSDLTYNCHRVPFVDEFDIPEDRRPYVFPSCGHVHGYSKSLVGRPCPLCRTSGAFVPVSLTFEESFGSGTPSHVFNPCGHVASLECCETWSSIRVPAIGCPFFSRDTCAACPFCRTTLNTQTPFSKLILQSDLTGNNSPGA